MPKYLSTKEACKYLGIKDTDTLYAYIKSGKLKAHKLGGVGSRRHWRISQEDLEDFLNGQKEIDET